MQKMEWIAFGFDLDLIWIEIGVLKKILRNVLPVMGTIFLVYIAIVLLYIFTSNKKLFTSK